MDDRTKSRAGWRLSAILWGTAWVALALATLLARADPPGVLGVALGGGVFWVVAFLSSAARDRALSRKRVAHGLIVPILLASAGCVEALGAWSAFAGSAFGQVYWFAIPTGFAAAGLINASRREPSDSVFAGQLFFHGFMMVPTLGRIAAAFLSRPNVPDDFAVLTKSFINITGIAAPLLFIALLAIVTHDRQRPTEERDAPWSVLVAAQAAYVVALFRWAQHGVL